MKKIFLLVVFLTIVFLVLLYISFLGKKTKPAPGQSPTISTQSNNLALPGVKNDSAGSIEAERSFRVGKLINILPHEDDNFSLFYSFSTKRFSLYLNPSNNDAGNKEFDAFLKKNGVENRSWIKNLDIVSTKPSPGL